MAEHKSVQQSFDYLREQLNRRDLITGAGAAGVMSLLGMQKAVAGGHTGDRPVMSEAEQEALEQANDKLVADFVRDYATRDADVLDKYVADDVVYQITPGMPNVVGREAFHKHNKRMLEGLKEVEWINLRQFTIGQIVINDRIDEFYPFPGSKIPRMRFRVAGYFLVEDNKIQDWLDFPYPGSKQLIEPAPKA